MSRLNKLKSGVSWGTGSAIINMTFQVVFMGVMARLLTPADFGLVAIATICLQFFQFFTRLGLQAAIIQKEKLDDGDVQAALFVSLAVSIFLFVLIFLLAPLAEYAFQFERLTIVIRVLAINILLSGLFSVSFGLLRRNTKFDTIAKIEVVGYLIGYGVVGLSLAFSGFGVWALVATTLTQSTVIAIWSYAATRHPINLSSTRQQKDFFISFGGKLSIIGFFEFLTTNISQLVVGKVFGSTHSGIFNRAYFLGLLPVKRPTIIITMALYPIICSMQKGNDEDRYHGMILGLLIVGIYAASVSAGIAVAAPELIGVLLGNQWLEAIPILQILIFSVTQNSLSQIAAVNLDALGDLNSRLKVQSISLVSIIILLFALVPYGIYGICIAIVMLESLQLGLYIRVLSARFDVPGRLIAQIGAIFVVFGFVTYRNGFSGRNVGSNIHSRCCALDIGSACRGN